MELETYLVLKHLTYFDTKLTPYAKWDMTTKTFAPMNGYHVWHPLGALEEIFCSKKTGDAILKAEWVNKKDGKITPSGHVAFRTVNENMRKARD